MIQKHWALQRHSWFWMGFWVLDLAHAYDYISQEFILEILAAMDFPESFIEAIKTLMRDQKGRVIINNDLSPLFEVNNGGKQGDPLFPLIYIIANEVLAALLETHPETKTCFSGSDRMGAWPPSDRTPKNKFWSKFGQGW